MSSKITTLAPIRQATGRSIVNAKEKVLAIVVSDDHPDTPPDRVEVTYRGQTIVFRPEWNKEQDNEV